MPIYEYECLTCGLIFEKRQSFHDEPKAECPNGHQETRRLLSAPVIVFKGSGFYVTDSKGHNSANGIGTNSNSKNKASQETKAKTEPKAESSTEAT